MWETDSGKSKLNNFCIIKCHSLFCNSIYELRLYVKYFLRQKYFEVQIFFYFDLSKLLEMYFYLYLHEIISPYLNLYSTIESGTSYNTGYFKLVCCMQQLVNEFRQMAEDAWRRVHRLFIVEDEWKLERHVDDISVYSQCSSSLGKILKLEVSYLFYVRI